MAEAHQVDIGGRPFRLTNLTKVMYPATGLTKAGVVDYYRRVAPAILEQLRDRPVTRIRWPDGVREGRFFEKNVPAGAPSWLRRQTLVAGEDEDGTEVTYPFLDDLAGLVWAANAGALELHTPQWRVGPRGGETFGRSFHRGVSRHGSPPWLGRRGWSGWIAIRECGTRGNRRPARGRRS